MRRRASLIVLLGAAILVGPATVATPAAAASRSEVTLLAGSPSTLDPALQSDIGSAFFSAQTFESLTTFDLGLVLRPALAAGWDVNDDGRQIVFHLRSGLTFSDGSALTGADVVGSWLRVIDPHNPSQLASLLLDVRGAREYLTGQDADPGSVGLRADGLDVTVDLVAPGADFPAIVSSPTFGIVPPAVWRDGHSPDTSQVASSGAYTIADVSDQEITLQANDRYWAGRPAIATAHLLADIGGRSAVTAFEDGALDYAGIASYDAAWIRYDATLGPQLRAVPSLSLSFIGLTTDRPPFDDVRVRQAFGAAVDWARLASLAAGPDEVAADSMVPPGIPGAGDGSWLPAYDPDRARTLLADAGFPGGRGFPDVTFAAGGIGPAEGIAAELQRELGITVRLAEYDDHFGHLHDDPAEIWSLGWVADYPGANDFLGVLLGTGSTNNYGRWSSSAFDAAIAEALATRDATASAAAFERALGVVQDEVPVVPLLSGDGWALARDGLLGADQNGLGILRLAGLAWR